MAQNCIFKFSTPILSVYKWPEETDPRHCMTKTTLLWSNVQLFSLVNCTSAGQGNMVPVQTLQADCLQGLVLVNLNLRGSSDKNPQTQAVGNSDESSLN